MTRRERGILTEYDHISAISGKPRECMHHLIGGHGRRNLADEDGLKIPLTNEEHNLALKATERIHGNPMAEILSRMLGQLAYEKEYYRRASGQLGEEDPARDAFRKRYGISYL